MKLKIVLALLLFPLQVWGQIHFNRLDRSNLLPQINIMSIYQDETGAMWFGTTGGLCRYNGFSTQVFRSSPEYPGLTRNNILSITGGDDGAVYIRAGYDLIRYDVAGESFTRIGEGVSGIFHALDRLWVNVGESIYTWSEQENMMSLWSGSGGMRGNVTALWVSDGGDVWAGGDGGLKVSRASKGGAESRLVLEGVDVYSLCIDSEGLVWVGTEDSGIYVLNGDGSMKWRFSHIPGQNSISHDFVRTIIEDERGDILAGTFFGLNSFDRNTGLWTNHIHDDTLPGSLSHSSVYAVYRDAQNTIWVGTYFGGVNYFNRRSDIFEYYNASSTDKSRLSFPFVGRMTEDGDGNLWICTEGGGLNRFDPRTRQFSRYLYYERGRTGVEAGYNLKGICYDPESNKLYIGIHNAGMFVFDVATRTGAPIDHSEWLWGMQPYRGSIIALTKQGLHRIEGNRILPFSDDGFLTALVNRTPPSSFFIDSGDRIWMSTGAGLRRVDIVTGEEKYYLHDDAYSRSFGKFDVTSFVETRQGEVFFGTLGSGLFRYSPETDDFDNYTEANGSVSGDFNFHISEMGDGNLLLLHDKTFSIFDPAIGATVYRSAGNFPLTGFFEGNSSYITRGGEIFIGGVNGLVSVEESRLATTSPTHYAVYFDRLLLGGTPVTPGDDTKILSKTLPLTDAISLRHNQNNFSIEFASSDYSQHDTVQDYEYILEGLDTEFHSVSSNMITYTNINPGKYNLVIRKISPVKNGDDRMTRSLAITIKPPFYGTTFAYIIYALLSAAILAGIIFFLMWRYRINTSLEMERKENENNERMNQMKLGFFTNISHEFRTPLTLIMAQIEHILSTNHLEPALQRNISKVHDNATHMRELITELLDFRKMEQGFHELKIEQVEMVTYIKDIYLSFTEYADKHDIRYRYDFPRQGAMWGHIDRVQLKKAIYNLLSNAFKYTPDGGEITVRLKVDERIHIVVEDNGIGISSEALSRIFERFYQAEYRTSGFSLGTGIGLALTKMIIEKHMGEISVSSTLDEGSIFDIALQTGYSHFEEVMPPQQPITVQADPGDEQEDVRQSVDSTDDDPASDQLCLILIVEDNEQMRSLLVEIFSPKYRVLTAVNGRQGLEMAEEHLPDIILSDVMMPEMSGREMCRRIKNDMKLSHIPVVMLTSLDSADQTVEGYMFGADDYVVKPFNVEILKARCSSMVKSRQRLYHHMIRSREVAGQEIKSEQEAQFMERVTEIIRANFDNPEFDMNMLASELCIGRNKLYISIKDISGMTPNEFALVTKLRESTVFLKNHQHLNISEIADRLGFSSLKYFSKCFKTFYGVSPARWRKDNEPTKGG